MNTTPLETVIDWDSFSPERFDQHWNFGYPWGTDHNGSARMSKDCITVSGNTLTLAAKWAGRWVGKSDKHPHLPIRYYSGAVHAVEEVCINETFPAWEIKGDFKAPTARGTWPAFWLTAKKSWPPELDILEFKGDSINWHNTFHQPNDCRTDKIPVKNAHEWHHYRVWIELGDNGSVGVHYYIDGNWTASHDAPRAIINCPLHLIINLQMEGSSGKPGPRGPHILFWDIPSFGSCCGGNGDGSGGETFFSARNVYVGRRKRG